MCFFLSPSASKVSRIRYRQYSVTLFDPLNPFTLSDHPSQHLLLMMPLTHVTLLLMVRNNLVITTFISQFIVTGMPLKAAYSILKGNLLSSFVFLLFSISFFFFLLRLSSTKLSLFLQTPTLQKSPSNPSCDIILLSESRDR